jgi:xanthine/CO dehydrogenase XdhC/CoxF family maturation factor
MTDTIDPLQQVEQWTAQGHDAALATVVSTWGSSPRPVGSQMAISDAGDFIGSVSGGCIEGAVIQAAQESMRTSTPKLLEFGVTNEMAWEVGLACGGRVQVWVEPVGP